MNDDTKVNLKWIGNSDADDEFTNADDKKDNINLFNDSNIFQNQNKNKQKTENYKRTYTKQKEWIKMMRQNQQHRESQIALGSDVLINSLLNYIQPNAHSMISTEISRQSHWWFKSVVWPYC